MICRTCLRRVPTPSLRPIAPRAAFATTARVRNAAAAAPATLDNAKPPSAPKVDPLIDPFNPPEAKTPLSSCPAGTVLQGLNYIKGKTDPVALADEAYPEWLWKCLEVKKTADAAVDANAGDEFCMFPLCLSSLYLNLLANHQPPPLTSQVKETTSVSSEASPGAGGQAPCLG